MMLMSKFCAITPIGYLSYRAPLQVRYRLLNFSSCHKRSVFNDEEHCSCDG